MPTVVTVTASGIANPGVAVPIFEEAEEIGNRAALEHWFAEYEPRHFTQEWGEKYGYQHRAGQDERQWVPKEFTNKKGEKYFRNVRNTKYFWKKEGEGLGTDPNVRTGLSRDGAKTVAYRVQPDHGVDLAFTNLPQHFFQYLKAGQSIGRYGYVMTKDSPHKFEELVVVLDAEAEAMARVKCEAMAAWLNGEGAAKQAASRAMALEAFT